LPTRTSKVSAETAVAAARRAAVKTEKRIVDVGLNEGCVKEGYFKADERKLLGRNSDSWSTSEEMSASA
jgi:hypothetical protein